MIRVATREDLSVIGAIELACFGADAWSAAAIEAEFQAPTRRMFVAEDEAGDEAGDIIGFAGLMTVAQIADVQRIAVLPAFRRGGVGAGLLTRLIEQAGAASCERLMLEVASDNTAALTMYATHGFVQISARRAYYPDGRDALSLSRTLQF